MIAPLRASRYTSLSDVTKPRNIRLPGPLLSRILLWLLVFLAFPVSVTAASLSFQLEVLGRSLAAIALPPESDATLSASEQVEGVLRHLERAEKLEIDPWLRDDIRIAWITVLEASRGNQQPHIDATFRVLGLHPDKVWPAILARREAILGRAVDLPHNKKQPMAESREGNAPQKTCAYGAASDQRTGTSCSTVTKREARRTLTSEFGHDVTSTGVAAPADKKPCASERRTRKRRAA